MTQELKTKIVKKCIDNIDKFEICLSNRVCFHCNIQCVDAKFNCVNDGFLSYKRNLDKKEISFKLDEMWEGSNNEFFYEDNEVLTMNINDLKRLKNLSKL